jgi:hypothetical protein
MTSPLTTEKLDELERLEAEATPGPWMDDHEPEFCGADGYTQTYLVIGGKTWFSPTPDTADESIQFTRDAKLIVALVNAAPAMLDEIDRLRAAIRLRIPKGHNDTCQAELSDGYPCNCGHAAIVEAIHPTTPLPLGREKETR